MDEHLDQLRDAYRAAVDAWMATIQADEVLSLVDHSMVAWNRWEHAGLAEEEARRKAKAAREEYENGLRAALYGI